METPFNSLSYLLFISVQTFLPEFIFFIVTHLFHYNNLKNQSSMQNILISNKLTTHHPSIIYTKEQPDSHFETNTTDSYIY